MVRFKNEELQRKFEKDVEFKRKYQRLVTRRKFLGLGGAFLGGCVAGYGGDKMVRGYFNDSKMKISKKMGYLLADLHTHIAKRNGLEDTLKRIVDVGIVGTSVYQPLPWENKLHSYDYGDRFCYESVIRNHLKGCGVIGIGLEEVDKGRLAKIDIDGRIGYVINVHEITSKEKFHVLSIGCSYDFISNNLHHNMSMKELSERIHNCGGLIQLNHFYTVSNEKKGLFPYRWISDYEEKILEKIAGEIDLFEIFNAQQINLAFGFDFLLLDRLNAAKNNKKAKEFVEDRGLMDKATKNSDAHNLLEQVGIVGNFIPVEYAGSWEGIRHALSSGEFVTSENKNVSKKSFLKGRDMFAGAVSFLAK